MSADAFDDPAVFMRDLPPVAPYFAHRAVVIVDPDAVMVGALLSQLPDGTMVYGAYTYRASMVTEDLQLHVCLVHQSLPAVPEGVSAPRVTVSEFHAMVTS